MTTGVENAVIRHTIAASPAGVWGALVDLKRMAAGVPDVRSIGISVGSNSASRLVDWSVWLKGFELQWQEEQVLDAGKMRIDFHQTQGMFALYKGSWQLSAAGEGTELAIDIDFDSGMPHLSQYVNPVLAGAFAALARDLAEACGKRGVSS